MEQNASIIAVGTEVTDGQIIDRNSSWMAQRLEALGIRPKYHFSVPDSYDEALAILNFASTKTPLIFICGGLGPTQDDFTRDIVSKFCSYPLKLNEESWKNIQEKLKSRGVTLREGHKRQAHFPENAKALDNDYGVAPGFYLEHKDCKLWVLPGPPKELESVWQNGVHQQLEKIAPQKPKLTLQTWSCLGVAESELAHVTEEHFGKYNFHKEFGYRISLPYVEVKIWTESHTEEVKQAFEEYQKVIAPYFITHDLKQLRAEFVKALSEFESVFITDELSEGLFVSKFEEILKDFDVENLPKISIQTQLTPDAPITHNISPIKKKDLVIHIQRIEEKQVQVIFIKKGKSGSFAINIPSKNISNYAKLYVLERILYEIPSIAFMSSE